MKQKVIIVGGGFAGVRTALDLAKKKNNAIEIILISNQDYFEYYPAMYRVVTGSSHSRVKIPLAEIFRQKPVTILVDTIASLDPKNKSVTGLSGNVYEADFLVMALGSQMTYFNIEGVEEVSFNFRSIDRALQLRERIHEQFEKHSHGDKEETLVSLHFVIVGGGASGVELAGELALYTRALAQTCNVPESFITIDLIEAASRVLPVMDEKVSEKATQRLRELGVNVLANRTLVKSESWTAFFKDMEIGTRTVIWTAGVKNNDLYKQLAADFEFDGKGRVVVDDFLQAKGYQDVFILGDNASTPYAGLAQTAIYDGAFLAKNILQSVQGRESKLYAPKPVSYDIPIGPGWAILISHGITLYGKIAWYLRHIIDLHFYLSILPARKAWQTFFARPDLSEINRETCNNPDHE